MNIQKLMEFAWEIKFMIYRSYLTFRHFPLKTLESWISWIFTLPTLNNTSEQNRHHLSIVLKAATRLSFGRCLILSKFDKARLLNNSLPFDNHDVLHEILFTLAINDMTVDQLSTMLIAVIDAMADKNNEYVYISDLDNYELHSSVEHLIRLLLLH